MAHMRSSKLSGPGVLAVAWLASGWAGLAADVTTNAPRIACSEPSFFFGTVPSSAVVAHDFVVRNVGGGTLIVSRVQASCGCVAAQPDTTNLPAGASAKVHASFALQGRKGHQRKSIRVWSNDSREPYYQLILEGDGDPKGGLEPQSLNFGTVSESTAVRTAVLTDLPASIQITNVVCDSSLFVPEVGTNRRQVLVRLRPPLPTGLVQSTVRAYTDDPSNAVLSLAVSYLIVPPVRVFPSTLSIPHGEQYVTRTIWVRPGRAAAFEIRDARCSAEAVTPLLTKIGPGIYRVDVKNIPVSDALRGKSVTLVTSLPELPFIEIPFLLEGEPGR